MRGPISSLWKDRTGSSAAEMALVTPLLMVLMFGSFELGNYFLDEHIVVKAVRDAARYASRRSFTDYTGCSGSPGGTVLADTQNVAVNGSVSGGSPRLWYWTNGATTVSVQILGCYPTAGGQNMTGIYTGSSGAPVVRVTAAVPYTPLVGRIGFNVTGLSLNARSEAAVMGI